MATGPTTTAAMLREVRAAGPVTTTLLAVIGIDQVIGLVAFAGALPLAIGMAGASGQASPYQALGQAAIVVVSSPLLGALVGGVIDLVARQMRNRGELMVVTLSAMSLTAGLAQLPPVKPYTSLLLIALFAGATLVNRNRVLSNRVFESTATAMPVIYILFFALAGAKIDPQHMRAIGLVGVVYVIARCAGKWLGGWIGGTLAEARPTTRRVIGLGLFSQGGVAIALALSAADALRTAAASAGDGGAAQVALGSTVEAVILGSTLVLFVVGPPAVRLAVTRVGEAGQARAA